MRKDRNTIWTRIISSAGVLVLLAGCATTTRTTSTTATSPATSRSARLTTEAPPPAMRARAHSEAPATKSIATDEKAVRALFLEVSALLESARETLRAGEPEGAAVLYDEGLRRLQDSGLEPEEDPQIGGLWETILTEVRDLEIDALVRGEDAAGHPQELSPVDSLEEIDEELDQELAEVEDEEVAREVASAPVYELPIVSNRRVQTVLDYFTGPRRQIIERGLHRSGRYMPMIQRILREEGLPPDLAWLPLIESSFKHSALSRAGAKGLWQFIPSTGRKYGLRIDWYVDERADPEKATRAAAHYLKDLYGMFGDWYLALAAYNCGEGRVSRSLRRTGGKDFWDLARVRAIPSETRGYVPAFLAGLTIAKDPAAYGFDTSFAEPWSYETVEVEGPADLQVLARCAGTNTETLRDLNPELRRSATSGKVPYSLRIPAGKAETFLAAYADVPESERLLYADHRVRPGETLTLIARRYGSNVRAIAHENGIRNPHRIRVGSLLRIPRSGVLASSGGSTPVARRSAPSQPVVHVVRHRETLTHIARRYGTTAGAIARANGLRSAHRIYPGQRLRITAGSGSSGTVFHRVRRGDTLYEIARLYNTSVSSLRRWNGMRGNRIHPGDRLKIVR